MNNTLTIQADEGQQKKPTSGSTPVSQVQEPETVMGTDSLKQDWWRLDKYQMVFFQIALQE